MAHSLARAYGLLSADPRVKAIVLTGADPSNKTFCAGMDLTSPVRLPSTRDAHRDTGGLVALAMHNCSKPIIAALNGSAVGVGITMALPASVRVVSRDAKIGFVFAGRGLLLLILPPAPHRRRPRAAPRHHGRRLPRDRPVAAEPVQRDRRAGGGAAEGAGDCGGRGGEHEHGRGEGDAGHDTADAGVAGGGAFVGEQDLL
uniref:Enoyl-hydratase isomerase family protein n=1 Tax=Colletotrichum fructicola (strain Nara gc5) TaxID=1213859 RepID=L2G0X3_COLFN